MSRKLLLADDSITIQKVIGITFVNEDFDLSVVGNGDAALEKARAERPDLILADVFMPGKNGYELCAAVKSDPALSKIPVLLLTGTFEPFDEIKANQAGADGWIAKPFESQTLINRVQELLAKAAADSVVIASLPETAKPMVGELSEIDEPAREEAAVEADIWEELGEIAPSSFAMSATPPGVAEAMEDVNFDDILEADEEPPFAAETADDVWDTVSFDDEDSLVDTGSAEKAVSDDIWASGETVISEFPEVGDEEPFDVKPAMNESALAPVFEAPAAASPEDEDQFVFAEEESAAMTEAIAPSADELLAFADEPLMETEFFVESTDEDDLMDLNEDDILLLDEAEIFEEEEPIAETYGEPEAGVSPLADDDIVASSAEMIEESPLVSEDFFGGIVTTPEAEAALPEAESIFAESMALVFEPEPEVSAFQSMHDESESVIPELGIGGGSDIEDRVRALSDKELSAIVEKVAGSVIERLAGTVLEKIVWEVVPDLAETLIKEEIHQIREGLRQTG